MIERCNNSANDRKTAPLRLGFVPLLDCAPLVMAHELSLFAKYGLRVTLHRELGWATIRDKIVYGELDAAHALAAMPVAASLGVGSVRCDCVAGLVLNLHGNAITLSTELWKRGVRDATSLRDAILRARHENTFTFGAVGSASSHLFLLRQWLRAGGISPERNVRIVMVPPPQMAANLKAGHLDGFCVGEPWNSVAVQARAGWVAGVSAELAPGHPEKVLMVRREFAERRPVEHAGLLAALLDACEFCDEPANHANVAATLARREYVGAGEAMLRRTLGGDFDFGPGGARQVRDFIVFSRDNTNEPTPEKAAWVLNHSRESFRELQSPDFCATLAHRVFRRDLFAAAVRLRGSGVGPRALNDISTARLPAAVLRRESKLQMHE